MAEESAFLLTYGCAGAQIRKLSWL